MIKIIIYNVYIIMKPFTLHCLYTKYKNIKENKCYFSKLRQCGFLGGGLCLLHVVLFRRYVSQDYNFGHRYLVNL